MAEVRAFQSKVDVKIKLWPQDLADIVTQPEVMMGFSKEEIREILQTLNNELNNRGEQDESK